MHPFFEQPGEDPFSREAANVSLICPHAAVAKPLLVLSAAGGRRTRAVPFRKRLREPPHVILHENLHGRSPDGKALRGGKQLLHRAACQKKPALQAGKDLAKRWPKGKSQETAPTHHEQEAKWEIPVLESS